MSSNRLFDIEAERYEKSLSLQRPFQGKGTLEIELESKKFSTEQKACVWKAYHLLESSSYVGRPDNYIAHPMRVALYCLRYGNDVCAEEVALALIHNILEVTTIQPNELEKGLGRWIAQGCEKLAVDRKRQKGDPEYLLQYYKKLYEADPAVQRIKIFDKLDNLLVLFINPNDTVRLNYLKEINERLLGMVARQTPSLIGIFKQLIQDNKEMGHRTLNEIFGRFS